MPKFYRVVERMTVLVEHFVEADHPEDAASLVRARWGAEEYDRLIAVEASVVINTEETDKALVED